ncbi:KH domain-containing protein [Okeania hirsuta]|uniref:KH domain-containing protein n=1 Tax=Okeania hirsuta TaxID=1458930 RepID=A0A3N6RIV8_9CYAN|nr:KH domain-containing protein [Okeania sp. SIO2B9]RQH33221.1 KH domain-containing protein [Okeania hirsuta]
MQNQQKPLPIINQAKKLPIPKPAKPVTVSQLKQQLPSLRNNSHSANPDYAEIVRFLIEPFLDSPESLRVDCEVNPRQAKAWIRLAFDELEKGRVYGRGGRNIQAVRTVLAALAQTAGQSVHLEIYEDHSETPRPSPSYSDSNREEGTYDRKTMPISRPSYNRQRVSRSRSTTPSPIIYKRDDRGMR